MKYCIKCKVACVKLKMSVAGSKHNRSSEGTSDCGPSGQGSLQADFESYSLFRALK